MHKPGLARRVSTTCAIELGWDRVPFTPGQCGKVDAVWYEHPRHGDEAGLLFWDGTEMWQTNEFDVCLLSDLPGGN